MNKSILLMSIIFLASLFMVSAYNSTQLKNFYSLNDSTSPIILIDKSGNSNLSTSSTLQTWLPPSDYKGKLPALYNESYSINYWINYPSSMYGHGGFYIYYNNSNYTVMTYEGLASNCDYFSRIVQPTPNSQNYNFFVGSNSICDKLTMITIVYDAVTNQYYFYENGVYNALASNPQSIATGVFIDLNNPSQMYDLSVWNTQLSPVSDLITLYNSGNPLNYSATINANTVQPLTSGCIDNFTFCQNIGYNNFGIAYCNSYAESSFCSGGCANNICQTNGSAQCYIPLATYCSGMTSYTTCDDSNSDGYLDLYAITNCNAGQFCTQGFNHAFCVNSTDVPSLSHNPTFTVTPYTSNADQLIKYTLDATNKVVFVNSNLSLHEQLFAVNVGESPTWISRTCDYKESSIVANNDFLQSNASINNTIVFATSSLPTIVNITIALDTENNATVQYLSNLGQVLNQYTFTHNATLKQVCVYYGITDLFLFCDTGVQSYDDLQNINLVMSYDFVTSTYTARFQFNRGTTSVYNTIGTLFYPSSINSFTVSGFATMSHYDVKTFTTPSGFTERIATFYNHATNRSESNYLQDSCIYTSTGLYTVRTYLMNYVGIDYSNYYDYNINVNSLNNPFPQDTGTSGDWLAGRGLSQSTKYIIVLFTIILILSAFITMGFMFDMVNASFIVGMVLSFFITLIFVALKWIEAWIPLAMLIIGVVAGILVSTVHKPSAGV